MVALAPLADLLSEAPGSGRTTCQIESDLALFPMTTANAIRFLHFEAAKCRDRDSAEALCLLLPALLKVFALEPMEDVEAAAFRHEFKQELQREPFQDATDRADARPAHEVLLFREMSLLSRLIEVDP
jgi:hypothetical protein